MNYRQALSYLNRFTDYEQVSHYRYGNAYNLDRIKRLLSLLGDPQERYHSVVISGTKGKGSTATILSSILSNSDRKTAMFISPHLISVRERIRTDGAPISRSEFSATLLSIKKIIDKNRLCGLTFFEVITAVAFCYFASRKVDIAVLEVGLGGRLDATNVVYPLVSIITPISYDHTDLLGTSLKKIAQEKCGIIKRGNFVVSAPQRPEALKVIRERCRQRKAQLLLLGKNMRCINVKASTSGTVFNVECGPLRRRIGGVRKPRLSNDGIDGTGLSRYSYYKNLTTPLIGRHQAINSLAALATAAVLRRRFGLDIREGGIRRGLKRARFPGRFQIIRRDPYIILDGAQNRASALSLKRTFMELFGKERPFLILGISSDKDIEGIGSILCPVAEVVIFTKAQSLRAEDPELLARMLGRFCNSYYVTYDIKDALAFARAMISRKGSVIIAGSLFLVGDALRILR